MCCSTHHDLSGALAKTTFAASLCRKWHPHAFRWQDGQQFERQLVNDFDRWDVHCADEATLCADDITVVIRQQVRSLLATLLVKQILRRPCATAMLILGRVCSLGACVQMQSESAHASGPAPFMSRNTCVRPGASLNVGLNSLVLCTLLQR